MHPTNRWLLVVFLIGAIVLSACGGPPAAPAPAPTSAPAANAPAAPVPTTAPAPTAAPAVATAPAAPATGTLNRDPKTLVIAYQESADNVDPAQTLNVANNIVTRPIYEGLLTLKGSSLTEVEPVLAESFTTNADKSEWTFKIRKGVKFHDGGVCDAQAIYDSIARTIVNKMPTWNILGRFVGEDPAKTIKVVDPNTLQFKFERPQPLFSLALAAAYGTGIISPKAFKEHEKNGDAGKEWLTTHADGTGPYKLDKFAPNDEFVLVRNPDYWRGWDDPNKFEKVIIKIYPENSTRRQLLEKGDVDIFTTPSAEDAEALQQTGNFEIGNADLIRIDYIAFNTHGKLADPRVRQAINYAFDYDGYIKGVRKDQGRRAEGPFPRSMAYHDPGVFVYPTDLAKAKELLTQAGWVEGTEVAYAYYPGFHGEDVGPILQAQLEQIGVKLKIEQQDISAFNGVFYGDQPPAQRPDMFWYAWWPNLDDPYDWSWILYHSTAAGSNGANAGFYSNKRVDQLIDQGLTETDPARLIAGPRAGPEAVAVVRHDYGLDRPLVEQYLSYMAGLFSGDLGRSFTTKRPVTDDLRAFFPATVELTLASLLIALALGLPIGIVAAVRRNSALDYAGRSFATFGLSLPPFWIGLLAQLLFYSGLTLLPVGGRLGQDVIAPPALTGLYTIDSLLVGQFATFLDALRHLVLPAVVLSFSTTAVFVRLVRAALLEVLRQDYVRTARAKGLRERSVVTGHALRNALLPVLTIGGLQLGLLLSGTLLVESIFSWPGIGRYSAQSIVGADYNGIMGVTIVLALIYLLVNTLVDLLYAWLDPRIHYS